MCLALIISQIIVSGSDYYVKFWTQEEYNRGKSKPTVFSTYENLYIYSALIFAVILVSNFFYC